MYTIIHYKCLKNNNQQSVKINSYLFKNTSITLILFSKLCKLNGKSVGARIIAIFREFILLPSWLMTRRRCVIRRDSVEYCAGDSFRKEFANIRSRLNSPSTAAKFREKKCYKRSLHCRWVLTERLE